MEKNHVCDTYCYNEDKVRQLQTELQKWNIANVALMFKAIADENRAKIIYALCQENELCVCDISNIIGATVATTSHHLRTLHKQGLVKYRKDGKLAFYSLDDEHVEQVMTIALEHIKHKKEGSFNE